MVPRRAVATSFSSWSRVSRSAPALARRCLTDQAAADEADFAVQLQTSSLPMFVSTVQPTAPLHSEDGFVDESPWNTKLPREAQYHRRSVAPMLAYWCKLLSPIATQSSGFLDRMYLFGGLTSNMLFGSADDSVSSVEFEQFYANFMQGAAMAREGLAEQLTVLGAGGDGAEQAREILEATLGERALQAHLDTVDLYTPGRFSYSAEVLQCRVAGAGIQLESPSEWDDEAKAQAKADGTSADLEMTSPGPRLIRTWVDVHYQLLETMQVRDDNDELLHPDMEHEHLVVRGWRFERGGDEIDEPGHNDMPWIVSEILEPPVVTPLRGVDGIVVPLLRWVDPDLYRDQRTQLMSRGAIPDDD